MIITSILTTLRTRFYNSFVTAHPTVPFINDNRTVSTAEAAGLHARLSLHPVMTNTRMGGEIVDHHCSMILSIFSPRNTGTAAAQALADAFVAFWHKWSDGTTRVMADSYDIQHLDHDPKYHMVKVTIRTLSKERT